MKTKQFNETLINNYGDLQVVVMVEELSELQKELCKYLRNKQLNPNEPYDTSHIKEEIADVQLCIGQARQFFNLDQSEIYEIKRKKMQRTLKRCIK
jgi:protein tyrosine phosphatase